MKLKSIITLLNSIMLCFLFTSCNNSTSDTQSSKDSKSSSTIEDTYQSPEEDSFKTKDTNSNNESKNKEDIKQYYLNKYLMELEQIENNDIQTNRRSYSTVEISSYANEFADKYDKLLNDIYKSLKEVLNSDEFSKIEADEVKWIKEKEAALNKVKEDAKGGGTMYAYMGSLTSLSYTHDRIYELLKYLGNSELTDKDEAYNYLLEQDKIYIDKQLSANSTLKYSRTVPLSSLQEIFCILGTIKEDFYTFALENAEGDDPFEYYVGKTSKKIYLAPNQGGAALLQIKNGAVVNHFNWISCDDCAVWR